MSDVLRHNRKGSDRDITRLNALGFCLKNIAKKFDCHPTSITLRLKSLKIAPSNTRRAFMETVYKEMPADYQENLADILEADQIHVKDYVKGLIEADLAARRRLVPPVTENSIVIQLNTLSNQ